MQTKLAGEYNIVVTKPDGTTTETGWFKNLILDQGLDRVGVSGAVIPYCQLGTGTNAPDVTQVGLTARVAGQLYSNSGSLPITVVNSGSPDYKSIHTIPYSFAQGAVVGNISEIGVGWAASGNVLFSRALISDTNGNPTTITCTSIDQLTVYYKLTFTPNTGVQTGTLDISGTTYSYSASMATAGSWMSVGNILVSGPLAYYEYGNPAYNSGWAPGTTTTLGPITSALTGVSHGWMYGTPVVSPYTLGTYYRDTTYRLAVGDHNYASGIGGFAPDFAYQDMPFKYVFTPAIPKDNTKTLDITVRISWGRAA
jgi:hypothetical protein